MDFTFQIGTTIMFHFVVVTFRTKEASMVHWLSHLIKKSQESNVRALVLKFVSGFQFLVALAVKWDVKH